MSGKSRDKKAAKKKRGGAASAVFGFLFALLIVAAAGAGGAYLYGQHVYTSAGPMTEDGAARIVVIGPGSGVQSIANELKAAGAIDDDLPFRLAVRATQTGPQLKAGEYAIESGASLKDIVDLLVSGRAILHSVTIPEGLTSAMVMERIAADPILSGDMPEVIPAEGVLLPDTYKVQRGETREALIARMIAARQTLIADLWPERQPGLPFDTVEEMIKLASIVEKETGIAQERPLVAAVFVNRMRKRMRLETDPTIIYGVCLVRPDSCKGGKLVDANGKPRGIRASELVLDTGYNTYRIDGLPPTPICNPGAEAIRAVLNPPVTDALFFVTDGTGGHVFSATYAQHAAHVSRLREREAAQRSGSGGAAN